MAYMSIEMANEVIGKLEREHELLKEENERLKEELKQIKKFWHSEYKIPDYIINDEEDPCP